MKKILFIVWSGWCFAGMALAEEFPSEQERVAISQRLSERRQAIETEYKKALKACYQNFDVNTCRIEARERRIQADKALRPEELTFNAMERRIHAQEERQRLAEKNSEAQQKDAQAQRAQALQAHQQHVDAVEQKRVEQDLKGTHRGDYLEHQREIQEHRASVEKRQRERTKAPADPLPVPGVNR